MTYDGEKAKPGRFAGGVQIGGDAPVSVQSMLNVPAHDVEGNVAQAKSLYEAGCEIIRAAVRISNPCS